jgi:hypothetical protein
LHFAGGAGGRGELAYGGRQRGYGSGLPLSAVMSRVPPCLR